MATIRGFGISDSAHGEARRDVFGRDPFSGGSLCSKVHYLGGHSVVRGFARIIQAALVSFVFEARDSGTFTAEMLSPEFGHRVHCS